jgi:hypothetical protein
MKVSTINSSDFEKYGLSICKIAGMRGRPASEIYAEFEKWYPMSGIHGRSAAYERCVRLAEQNKLLPWELPDYEI